MKLPPKLQTTLEHQTKQRRPSADEEHHIQVECVRWFRLAYPHLRHALFAIPNGGRRDATTGARLKDEGVLAGVADLELAERTQHYGALFIEMKTRKGVQSESQKSWQRDITQRGTYKYVVCRSFDDFKREVELYLADR